MEKMRSSMRIKGILSGFLTGILILGIFSSADAQAGRFVNLSIPDLSDFPRITLYFDVTERDGTIFTDLSEDQVILRENGVEQEILHFEALNPGIQLVTAFNLSAPFAIQDISGKSRFDYIQESLLNWAENTPSSLPDDLSLISNDGFEITHLDNRSVFSEKLTEYNPDLQEAEANFNVLARAIELASDPVEQLGMKRVVLFFSPPVPTEGSAAINSLISQAKDNQVQVYVVLVSSPAFFSSAGAVALQNLTDETNGIYLTYIEDEPLTEEEEEEELPAQPITEPLPDLRNLFLPLRNTYILRYQSQIITTGNQKLELTITSPLGESLGEKEFFLDVQPPNPIFISPPQVIQRNFDPNQEPQDEESGLYPSSVDLATIIEFPDGHPRELEEFIFRVDGVIIEKQSSPPFDKITWDLTPYQTSGIHHISLEAVDIMGLNRQSLPIPVEIQVELPPITVKSIFEGNALEIIGLVAVLALGLILFALIAVGRIKPVVYFGMNRFFKKNGNSESDLEVKKIDPEQSKHDEAQSIIPATYRLIPVSDVALQLITEPIQISVKELTFGSDQNQALQQINHSSIAPLHTRIIMDDDGDLFIIDEGGTAGTWINYKQIFGEKPHQIKDGDIIHIGEAGFRIQELENKASPSKIEEKDK
jgi:hypothetical protein